jgi:hypothetical protein
MYIVTQASFGYSRPRRDIDPNPVGWPGSTWPGISPCTLSLTHSVKPSVGCIPSNPSQTCSFHRGKNNRVPPRGIYPQSVQRKGSQQLHPLPSPRDWEAVGGGDRWINSGTTNRRRSKAAACPLPSPPLPALVRGDSR